MRDGAWHSYQYPFVTICRAREQFATHLHNQRKCDLYLTKLIHTLTQRSAPSSDANLPNPDLREQPQPHRPRSRSTSFALPEPFSSKPKTQLPLLLVKAIQNHPQNQNPHSNQRNDLKENVAPSTLSSSLLAHPHTKTPPLLLSPPVDSTTHHKPCGIIVSATNSSSSTH